MPVEGAAVRQGGGRVVGHRRGRPRRRPLAFFVPGRIEVLGKHTDYAGGRTMVAAAERGFCMVALPRDDRQMTVIDARSGETIRFLVDPELTPQSGSWSNYPMTVARRMARNFPGACRGADIALVSDLPPAAGMSSSSALMVGVFLVLAEVNQLPARDEYWHNIGSKTDLAGYLGTIENGQSFGTLRGRPRRGHLRRQRGPHRHPLRRAEPHQPVRLLPGGVREAAAGAAGPRVCDRRQRRGGREDRRGAGKIQRGLAAGLGAGRALAARDRPRRSAPGGRPGQRAGRRRTAEIAAGDRRHRPRSIRAALAARLEHFMIESGEIIPEAGDALAGGDLRAFGRLVDRSQQAAERLLGNQVPETIFLAAVGAAAGGRGRLGLWGGLWRQRLGTGGNGPGRRLSRRLGRPYRSEFPQHAPLADFFLTAAGPAAFRVC